jgi:hypothetical protein
MQLSFTSFPEAMFFIVFLFAIGVLLYTFGWHILHDMNNRIDEEQFSQVTAKEVSHYFTDKGYVVCNITPVKNSNKWLAFLVKNGEYLIATVFTNGQGIEGHKDSLE